MEKVTFYRLWFFENIETGKKFYFENKLMAEIARFNEYKKYDSERLTINNFAVPVSRVQSILVHEDDMEHIIISVVKDAEGNELS